MFLQVPTSEINNVTSPIICSQPPHYWESITIAKFKNETISNHCVDFNGNQFKKIINTLISKKGDLSISIHWKPEGLGENKYLKDMGLPKIPRFAVMAAESTSKKDKVYIDVTESIYLSKSILKIRGYTLIDCISHRKKGIENHRVKLNRYLKASKAHRLMNYHGLTSFGRLEHSPDDDDNIEFYESVCTYCGEASGDSSKVFEECSCKRVYYCCVSCEISDMDNHESVHKSVPS